jgi:3-dehydrotetronate 4-kinase
LAGQGGLRTAQYLGVPTHPADADIEAGVVSLKSRSIAAADAVAQSLEALDWLREQGAQQIVFKYCSTFDSTPDGNIGPVAEALADALGVKGVVVCPAFPAMGRTIYLGHLFVQGRLLNQSGMENHPLTPMTDPDIRRWLGHQTRSPVGLVAMPTVSSGAAAIAMALTSARDAGEKLVIVDAITDADLVQIAAAATDASLITGGSGIAIGLPANFFAKGQAKGNFGAVARCDGPEAILAGSCSGATRGQIDHHAKTHPVLAIDVDKVMSGATQPEDVTRFLLDRKGQAPLAYTSGTPEEVRAAQSRHGRETLAARLDAFFAETARSLLERGVRRLVVAGGETSGAVVSALDFDALTIGPEIDPGVPVLFAGTDRSVALALKSGNFGAVDFFDKALARMVGQ